MLLFICFLSLQLNEFLQWEIVFRTYQNLPSVQKITCISAIADKKIISRLWWHHAQDLFGS